MGDSAIFTVILGTAGHIDHGKSSIVRRLSGIDPDRLPEERDRGLTIDLGFAPYTLTSGEKVGIIDVPGHEKFIKNMVAGASGIDLVLLVVAADDSVMPQTREHLEIMTLLGVERGVIAINKIDVVEEELVELVEEEIRELTEGTFLENAPIIPVSAVEGTNFEALQSTLEEAIRAVPPRHADGVFRMPIQRVFSARGHGTVCTGIPVSGQVAVGDRVEVLPIGPDGHAEEGRVRGLQAYKMTVDVAKAGHSSALNLSDIDFHQVHRGMVAATPGYFEATRMVEATVKILGSLEKPVVHRMPVRFHTGTAEALGRIYLLEDKVLTPGAESYAQFRFEEPIVVAPGDKYVFRQETPMLTLGGGEILDRSRWRLKAGKEYILESLERKERALESREDFVASIIDEAPFEVVDAKSLAKRTSLSEGEIADLVAALVEKGVLVTSPKPNQWLARRGIEQGQKRILDALDKAYRENPYRVAVPKPEVQSLSRIPETFFEPALQIFEDEGAITRGAGGRVRLPGRELELTGDDKKAYDLIEKTHTEAPLSPPRLDELAEQNNIPLDVFERMQILLLEEDKLVRVAPDLCLIKHSIDIAQERLTKLFQEEGPFSASTARAALDTTRKYAIPILEYCDKAKITRRLGDTREVLTP